VAFLVTLNDAYPRSRYFSKANIIQKRCILLRATAYIL